MLEVEHLLTRREVAELLNVSTRTLDRWREAGVGPAWMEFGGVVRSGIRYRRADVLRYLRGTVVAGAQGAS